MMQDTTSLKSGGICVSHCEQYTAYLTCNPVETYRNLAGIRCLLILFIYAMKLEATGTKKR
jgi:hypothetical protein